MQEEVKHNEFHEWDSDPRKSASWVQAVSLGELEVTVTEHGTPAALW